MLILTPYPQVLSTCLKCQRIRRTVRVRSFYNLLPPHNSSPYFSGPALSHSHSPFAWSIPKNTFINSQRRSISLFLFFVFASKCLADTVYVPTVNLEPCKFQCSQYSDAIVPCGTNYGCVCSAILQFFPGVVNSPALLALISVYRLLVICKTGFGT